MQNIGRSEFLLSEFIQDELHKADQTVSKLYRLQNEDRHQGNHPSDNEYERTLESLSYYVESALRSTGALAERLGVASIASEAQALLRDGVDSSDLFRDYEDDYLYSKPLIKASKLFEPLQKLTDNKNVTALNIFENILRKTAVILHESGTLPTKESDVRNEVLKVCKYAFPEAMREIEIPQIIKNYKGDLGVPSLRAMAEFKFIKTKNEMKQCLDGVYADMKGYSSDNWNYFYGVFYMTKPFYNEMEIVRAFEYVDADKRWTPIVINGSSAE